MKALSWCLLVSWYLGLIAQPAYAQYQSLDHVVAVVNKGAITASQLQARVARIRKNARGTLPPEKQLSQEVLEQMILERIQLQLADRVGVHVSEKDLNHVVKDVAKRNHMTVKQFRHYLQSQHISYRDVRADIRKDITINRLQNAKVSQGIHITNQQIDNYMESQEGKQQLETHYRLGNILLAVPESATKKQWDVAERQAKALIKKFGPRASPAYFMQQAQKLSKDKEIDLGWRSKEQLPALFANALTGLHIGDVRGPLRSANGFHILCLLAIENPQKKVMQQQVKVRHILIKPSITLSERKAIRRANQIWRDLTANNLKNFSKLAKTYSNDPGSKFQGGELGWVDLQQLDATFREQVQKAPDNKLLRPFHSKFGWHIAQVQGHREVDVSEQQLRQRIRQWLFQRDYQVKLQDWLQNIRKEAYVDIR